MTTKPSKYKGMQPLFRYNIMALVKSGKPITAEALQKRLKLDPEKANEVVRLLKGREE